MKYCTKCGASATDEQKFCVSCGEPLTDQASAKNLDSAPMPIYDSYAPKVTSKMEFVNLPENKPLKTQSTTCGILCYIAAGLNVILALVTGNTLMLLDAVILLVLGLLIHLKQSKICAIILLVYGIISVIINLIATGKFQGWLILLAGIYAVTGVFKLDKAWKEYQLR